jgi:hypothetical protein
MKKLVLILVSLSLFIACDNEPLDSDISGTNTNGNGQNTNTDVLALSAYSFDVNATLPLFGSTIVNSDFSFNSNNFVNTTGIETSFFGITINETVTISRNSSEQVTGFNSVDNTGTVTNTTLVTYSGNQISQIVYDYYADDEDDYTYNFAYSGNTITRTELGSNISSVFTFDENSRVIKKESFDATLSILVEILTYDSNNNCASSTLTGEENTMSTYGYDANENPLKAAFSDQYLLSFLNDDYSDEMGSSIAQFHSTNNWNTITTPEGTVNFTLQYDATNRITNRNGTYDLGDGVVIQQSETFQFVN